MGMGGGRGKEKVGVGDEGMSRGEKKWLGGGKGSVG